MLPRRSQTLTLDTDRLRRWWRNVDTSNPDGCWLWTGTINKDGYGNYSNGRAHRQSYEWFVGPIPDGLSIDHLCHNADLTCQGGATCLHRRCVKPAHLEPTTVRENTQRSPLLVYTDEERVARPGLRHGWYGTYTNHRCRCDDCREAHASYLRESRARAGGRAGRRPRGDR